MVSQEMLQLGTAPSLIRELFEYGKARGAVVGPEHVFDFSIGNPSAPPPAVVQETAIALLQGDPMAVHSYTSAQGEPLARGKFANSLKKRTKLPYFAENFYLTAGAAAALSCCTRGLTCPGDEWIVLAPYFPEYSVFIHGNGGKMLVAGPELPSFQPDFQDLEGKINEKTKAIIINSPNNPSAAVYTVETLEKLGGLLRRKSQEYGHVIYLISDEPYRELIYDGSVVPWVADYYENTLICYSFSKSLSLPGQRIGYVLVGNHVENHQEVFGAIAGAGRSLGYVNAPSLFQRVAAECCDMTSNLQVYKENRDILLTNLSAMGYQVGNPAGAFYLFPQALEEDDGAFCQRGKDFDLLFVPGKAFGVGGYFRISYCVSREKVEGSLEKFRLLAQSYGLN